MDAAGDCSLREDASPLLQMMWGQGAAHGRESVVLAGHCLDLSGLAGEAREAATREAIARHEPLIRGGRLSVHESLGEPDLLRLEAGGYVAIDIASGTAWECAAGEEEEMSRIRHGVRLAQYTDILEQMGLSAGRYGYIQDMRGAEVRYLLDAPPGPGMPCLWDVYLKTRAAVRATLAAPQSSVPALAPACRQCVWRTACFARLQRDQDLTLLPGLGRQARDSLREEFPTLRHLAEADVESFIEGERTAFPHVDARRLRQFQRRARLQRQPGAKPYLTRAFTWPRAPVELFVDIETDPLRGLSYLHGFVIREAAAMHGERFEGIFITDGTATAERDAFAKAMTVFRRHPDALVVHYAQHARKAFRRLAADYPEVASPAEIEAIFRPPHSLDLYLDVVEPGSEWPTHDLSIGSLARCCGFSWRQADPSVALLVEWFDRWARSRDPRFRQRLLACKEDDCRALRAVFDHLKTLPVQTD